MVTSAGVGASGASASDTIGGVGASESGASGASASDTIGGVGASESGAIGTSAETGASETSAGAGASEIGTSELSILGLLQEKVSVPIDERFRAGVPLFNFSG